MGAALAHREGDDLAGLKSALAVERAESRLALDDDQQLLVPEVVVQWEGRAAGRELVQAGSQVLRPCGLAELRAAPREPLTLELGLELGVEEVGIRDQPSPSQ